MRVDRDTSTLELRSGAGTGVDRPFWEAKAPLGVGLRAVVEPAADGPRIRVFTGGPGSKFYVPATTNTPVQVQATFTVTDGEVVAEKFSATYNFGHPKTVTDAVAGRAKSEALEFVTTIVATSPRFAQLWDAAAAEQATATAERAERSVAEVAAALAEACAPVVARVGEVSPKSADLAVNEHIRALAEAAVPAPETPGRATSGAEVVDAALRRLRDAGIANRGAATRLSELEVIALIVDRATNGIDDPALVEVVRSTAKHAYDVFYDVHYGTGNFPDRPMDPALDSRGA